MPENLSNDQRKVIGMQGGGGRGGKKKGPANLDGSGGVFPFPAWRGRGKKAKTKRVDGIGPDKSGKGSWKPGEPGVSIASGRKWMQKGK